MNTETSMKIDPDVKMPAAVLAAAKRSDDMQKALRNAPEGEVTEEGNPQTAEQGTTEKPLTAEQSPAPEPKPEVKPEPKPESRAESEDDSLEHRYKSLHGRYVKQEGIMKQMADEIRSLQNVIATLSVAPQNAPATEQPLTAEPAAQLTDEEVNEYGEDLLRVVGKKARAEVEPLLRARDEEISRLKRQLEGVNGFVQTDSREKLFRQLDEKLPEWRDLNTNQDFLQWLSLPDPYSGGIRHDMLKAAYAQGNANRVLAFFNGFLSEEAVVAPAQGEPNPATRTVPKVPLSTLAAPGKAKSAASDARPAEKPIINRTDIAKFYLDVSHGKYRGREQDKQKIEAQIFEATREGRIR